MGDLFGSFQNVEKKRKNETLDSMEAYEEHYMKLLRQYMGEIKEIANMMSELREERKNFYQKELPAIEAAMKEDEVLSAENKEEWLSLLQNNMEHSFQTSEALINHYVTKNLDEFEKAMKEKLNEV